MSLDVGQSVPKLQGNIANAWGEYEKTMGNIIYKQFPLPYDCMSRSRWRSNKFPGIPKWSHVQPQPRVWYVPSSKWLFLKYILHITLKSSNMVRKLSHVWFPQVIKRKYPELNIFWEKGQSLRTIGNHHPAMGIQATAKAAPMNKLIRKWVRKDEPHHREKGAPSRIHMVFLMVI